VCKYPQLHHTYIRHYVGDKVVSITNEQGNHGGTGSHVKTPHGNVVILTNAHVCNGVSENGQVFVTTEDGIKMPRRILQVSNWTDLCVIEGVPGYSGLSTTEPFKDEHVYLVGHPLLMPLMINEGEIQFSGIIDVFDHEMNPNDDNDKCNLPKNKIISIDAGFFEAKFCVIEIDSYTSNIVSLPGNSGSPVVDGRGNLVAVNFAGMSNAPNWGSFVTYPDIVKFIAPY
jgi:S1-C subfamily serine protease